MKSRINLNELPLRASKLGASQLEDVFGGACTGCGCGNSCDCIPGDSCNNGTCVKNQNSAVNQPPSGALSGMFWGI